MSLNFDKAVEAARDIVDNAGRLRWHPPVVEVAAALIELTTPVEISPFDPKNSGIGLCPCGSPCVQDDNYCSECGKRIIWKT